MKRSKGSLVLAFLLIALGVWYLLVEINPAFNAFAYGRATWPWQIIVLGGLFCLVGLVAWVPALFIPGVIIGGIGGILYYQNLTGDWASWAYAWTLLPGLVGIGLLIFGALSRRSGPVIGAFWNLLAFLILFGIFGSAFGALRYAAVIWPLGLILLGVYFIMRFMVGRRSKS
jgi:hypothetical protein